LQGAILRQLNNANDNKHANLQALLLKWFISG
jgi:hypothetical protein